MKLIWNALLIPVAFTEELVYPLYMQCDEQWGDDMMGVDGDGERSTICGEGCAMTSLSMALAGLNIPIDGELANPANFNTWLMANDGYTCMSGDCNNLVLDAVEGLTERLTLIGELPKPAADEIISGLENASTVYIAHVHNNHHFVLLTGEELQRMYLRGTTVSANYAVNDPFYTTTQYAYEDITDIIMYKIV